MPVRPLIRYPDPRLAATAAPVGEIDARARAVWQDLIDTMAGLPMNVGLAAPQIGEALRLCIVDASDRRDSLICMADPVVTPDRGAGTLPSEEGNPCLPGVTARVKRFARVAVAYTDPSGARVEDMFEGLWAASVQHQVDHMDGVFFLDRLSRVKRDMALRRARKAAS